MLITFFFFLGTRKYSAEKIEKANKNGLYSEVTVDLIEEVLVTDFSFVGALFSIVFLFIILILSMFIGKIVLNFVYGSKKNDFAILKVLGYDEKNIRIIDALEILMRRRLLEHIEFQCKGSEFPTL